MKKIFTTLTIAAMALCLNAQVPPSPNNNGGGGANNPGAGNSPVGGGAPIGSGMAFMLVMGAAYGSKKVFNLVQNRKSN